MSPTLRFSKRMLSCGTAPSRRGCSPCPRTASAQARRAARGGRFPRSLLIRSEPRHKLRARPWPTATDASSSHRCAWPEGRAWRSVFLVLRPAGRLGAGFPGGGAASCRRRTPYPRAGSARSRGTARGSLHPSPFIWIGDAVLRARPAHWPMSPCCVSLRIGPRADARGIHRIGRCPPEPGWAFAASCPASPRLTMGLCSKKHARNRS
jgi:hypothetical protein